MLLFGNKQSVIEQVKQHVSNGSYISKGVNPSYIYRRLLLTYVLNLTSEQRTLK